MPPRRGGRSRFTLVILVLTAITLITLDAQNVGPVERGKDALASVLSPVGDAVGWAVSPVGDLFGRLTDSDEKDDEIAALEARIAELEEQVIENASAAEELERFLQQADIDPPEGVATEVAQVVYESIANFDGQVIQIDKGTESGIVTGNPVLGPGGLIGVVADARDGRSVIQLIDDTNFAIGVRVVDSDEVAIALGQGAGEPLRVQDGIRSRALVEVGDVVVTAGGAGSLYPPGIPVGTVENVVVDEGELELEFDINPSGTYRDLTLVTIVLFDPATAPVTPEDDGETPDEAVPSPTPAADGTVPAEGQEPTG
jgi:rod shape-determining protein MreC